MANTSSYNSKTPTIRRLLKEASELASLPDPSLTAHPIDSNLFEWHFTIRGPASSPYESGIYHGRISLPPQYPLKPPNFRFLTPSGRFEVNREICLSISGHHEETWLPAWGVRTALVALRSIMADDSRGQIGGLETSSEVRETFAKESWGWKCDTCGKCNREIMGEWAEEVSAMEKRGEKLETSDTVIPPGLALAYKDGMAKRKESDPVATVASSSSNSPPRPTRSIDSTAPAALTPNHTPRTPDRDVLSAWIDRAIGFVAVALVFLLLRILKFI
ncbi:UBC-like protein [Eremomyces bilateralis CBS 781.70]|uniref:UBC-like protein n=1 Tax=Eremomyces bilateralis CBS 781.70 TaxID=1392243 RepID=A0A6G1FRC9_9PEZI|nr:UBC-like protein [Eremomyces bilateralis CBS 781.70]KAF1808288.1 UBC-like protein [Eremomyces bilateralis CBS 781.70]